MNNYQMKLPGPCKDCPDRSKPDEPNCHDVNVCSRWAEFQETLHDARRRTIKPEADRMRQATSRRVKAAVMKKNRH